MNFQSCLNSTFTIVSNTQFNTVFFHTLCDRNKGLHESKTTMQFMPKVSNFLSLIFVKKLVKFPIVYAETFVKHKI